MSTNLKALLSKAKSATPDGHPNAKHLHLLPIVTTLEGRGFNTYAAVRWLAQEGQITEAQIQTVYRSIRQARSKKEGAK